VRSLLKMIAGSGGIEIAMEMKLEIPTLPGDD
jgi:hypothetical protein